MAKFNASVSRTGIGSWVDDEIEESDVVPSLTSWVFPFGWFDEDDEEELEDDDPPSIEDLSDTLILAMVAGTESSPEKRPPVEIKFVEETGAAVKSITFTSRGVENWSDNSFFTWCSIFSLNLR